MQHAILLAGLTMEFVLGLFIGATLLCVAVGVGFWLGRRHSTSHRDDQPYNEEFLNRLKGLMQWSRGLAEEMSQYGSVVSGMSQLFELSDQPQDPQHSHVGDGILPQVVAANERLKRRLNHAEAMLQEQANEISAHMSEARTDSLTGLPNRRAFDEGLARAVAEWQRHGKPVSVLTLDVDYFKRVNDTYGHPFGDEVLFAVAEKLRNTMRESDLVSRVGGEEMAVILANSDLPEARQAATRARQAIEEMRFKSPQGELQVTVSLGIAQCRPGETGPGMVGRADEALYAAKRSGRNRSYWHDGCQSLPNDLDEAESESSTLAGDQVQPVPVDEADEPAQPDFGQVCDDLRRRLDEVVAQRLQR